VTLGNDTTYFQCAPAQICFPYTVSDGNANVTGEQLIATHGTIDTALNRSAHAGGLLDRHLPGAGDRRLRVRMRTRSSSA